MLTKKKGLPLSRLLRIKETDSRDSKREEQMRLQEESASPLLKKRKNVVKEDMKEEKEEESGPGKGAPSSGSNHFTLRSFPTVANPPSTQPLPHGPCLPTSPDVSPPLFMPAANWVVCGSCQMWGTVVPPWAAH